jgi:hypothetical protein
MGVLDFFFKNLAMVELFEKGVGDPPRRLPKNYVPLSIFLPSINCCL